MKRKHMLTVIVSGICVLLVASTVIAHSLTVDTPLYIVRMEQTSDKMHFLPTAVNKFTYTTEEGCTLDYEATGRYSGTLDVTSGRTCEGTCIEPTCPNTCWSTCDDPTCSNTCPNTCGATCNTCSQTCDTCPQTCLDTCSATCESCYPPCPIS